MQGLDKEEDGQDKAPFISFMIF